MFTDLVISQILVEILKQCNLFVSNVTDKVLC